ncbi:MAG: penicillin-binding protein [Candidatus Levybacteria bacterium]|nr:penicillin-binding protein [Candidatus Levybacteria bacterium]
MQLILDALLLIVKLLIAIGDGVIAITSGVISFTEALLKRFLYSTRYVFYSMWRTAVKPLKPKTIVAFHTPLLTKLRYFLGGAIFSFLVVFLPLLFILYLQDLPNPKSLSLGDIPQTTKIYDRNGTLLYQIYASQNRTLVPLSAIPKYFQQATIAIEDKDFYKHPGFDLTAIVRSLLSNISGGQLQGGSTITQQLIKSSLLTSETTLQRKIKEVVLAFQAEQIYTKDQILSMYFNRIPYGGTAWGAQAASEVYFGKSVQDLNLSESAFLAGIPRAPTIYSPYGTSPTAWKKRQKEVLDRMVELGYISQKQADDALAKKLSFRPPQTPIHAPHFVMYVKDILVKKYGLPMVEKGGLTVITTLDLALQQDAEKIVAEEVEKNAYLNLTNGAGLITNPKNGDILVMVGSKDFSDPTSGNVNVATARRQPGSSIKVITYSAALSNGFTAATILDDTPITFRGIPPYSPVNYDGAFHGRIPLRIALANSFNIPAVKTLNQIGIPTFLSLAKQMGITTFDAKDQYGLAITLGAAEVKMVDMATVYGVLANGGVRVDINPILKVSDATGAMLEAKAPSKQNDLASGQALANEAIVGRRVLDEGVAYIMSSILSDNQARALEFGINSPLTIPGKTVSVKTGTTDNKRDNWTFGYTPSAVVAVWVGNHDNSPMSQQLASGITGAAPIWNKLMQRVIANKPDEKQPVPANVVQKNCYGGKPEYFIKGTENSVNCRYQPPPSPTKQP